MTVKLICVGRLKEKFYADACAEFKKRDADGQRLAMALMAAYDAGKAAGEKKKEQEAE